MSQSENALSRDLSVVGTEGSFTKPPMSPGAALDRFRKVVRKVIQMQSTPFMTRGIRMPGSEPGADPRRESAFAAFGHIHERCEIEVVDYSTSSITFDQLDNEGLTAFLSGEKGTPPPWARVRWINCGGISWDVLSQLAIKYDLHPLSVENVLSSRFTSRSKADYYANHLFIHILCHSLLESEGSSSPLDQTLNDPTAEKRRHRFKRRGHGHQPARPSVETEHRVRSKPRTKAEKEAIEFAARRAARAGRIKAADKAIDSIKNMEDRVQVVVRNMYIFLIPRHKTLICFHQVDRSFGDPILARLRNRETMLRRNPDASLLLQALLDLVVDRAIEIVDSYHEKILKLERQILIRPKPRTVTALHVLSGDLTMHKRTLEPIKSLIFGLRRYDLDRAVAIQASEGDAPRAVGFLSHKAKVYLADVYDHTEHILSSFSMFESVTENLIAYAFNVISYDMNQTMRHLTLATIVFLPLTILTGYFGQNFADFWAVQQHSDLFFWEIAIPLMVVIVPLFLWGDLERGYHAIKKRIKANRIERENIE